MKAYADTLTEKAETIMQRRSEPIAYTWLHQLELRNAFRLRVFRKEISITQRNASLNLLLADLADGVLQHTSASLPETMIEAESLSTSYSEKLGTCSMDIFHVAAAMVLGISEFLSFDKRQIALAKAAGLKVKTA
jgi:predicted nucleic acid-binding protein